MMWRSKVRAQTNFIWWEGDSDDRMDEVCVKLNYGHRTTTETGGMGIMSDQDWKKRSMTMKFLGRGGYMVERSQL